MIQISSIKKDWSYNSWTKISKWKEPPFNKCIIISVKMNKATFSMINNWSPLCTIGRDIEWITSKSMEMLILGGKWNRISNSVMPIHFLPSLWSLSIRKECKLNCPNLKLWKDTFLNKMPKKSINALLRNGISITFLNKIIRKLSIWSNRNLKITYSSQMLKEEAIITLE